MSLVVQGSATKSMARAGVLVTRLYPAVGVSWSPEVGEVVVSSTNGQVVSVYGARVTRVGSGNADRWDVVVDGKAWKAAMGSKGAKELAVVRKGEGVTGLEVRDVETEKVSVLGRMESVKALPVVAMSGKVMAVGARSKGVEIGRVMLEMVLKVMPWEVMWVDPVPCLYRLNGKAGRPTPAWRWTETGDGWWWWCMQAGARRGVGRGEVEL